MGAIVGSAITTILTFISVPVALIIAFVGGFKGLVGWSSGVAARKSEAAWTAFYALIGAVLAFNSPAIWAALRGALGI